MPMTLLQDTYIPQELDNDVVAWRVPKTFPVNVTPVRENQ